LPGWRWPVLLLLDILSFCVWGFLVLWAGFWLYVLWKAESAKNVSAIQEAAAAAFSAAHIVAGYAVARGAETVLRRIANLLTGPGLK
jgi:hypothetical protein